MARSTGPIVTGTTGKVWWLLLMLLLQLNPPLLLILLLLLLLLLLAWQGVGEGVSLIMIRGLGWGV